MSRSADMRAFAGALQAMVFAALLSAAALPARAHDGPIATAPPGERDEWILLSRRVHGGFGSLIALGIRIGDDALRQLQATQREVDVTYWSGAKAPCPCVVDGILIVTAASPGQNSLRVSADPAPEGEFGRVTLRHKPTGRAITYIIPGAVGPTMAEINKLPSIDRWAAVMQIADEHLFARSPVEEAKP